MLKVLNEEAIEEVGWWNWGGGRRGVLKKPMHIQKRETTRLFNVATN
jgi:hypothetical protein